MKKILILILSFNLLNCYGQLSYKSTLFSTTYFDGNQVITGNQFKSIIFENENASSNYTAYQAYNGIATGMNILAITSSVLYLTDSKKSGFAYSAVGFALSGLLFNIVGKQKLDRSIQIRNGAVTLSYKF